jgi:hypothetical protein
MDRYRRAPSRQFPLYLTYARAREQTQKNIYVERNAYRRDGARRRSAPVVPFLWSK